MSENARADEVAAEAERAVDVAIVGAGPLGLALARALAGSALRVALVDSGAGGPARQDPRALALAHGSRQLLERLGAWNGAAATPIRTIHVSQSGGFGRTLIDADDTGCPALGYVMGYAELATALAARVPAALRLDHCRVEKIESAIGADAATLTLRQPACTRIISARLVVHAEGTAEVGPGIRARDYRQSAIVARVQPARAHESRAWERFTPDGPLALLPLGADYALVLAAPTATAARLLQMDEPAFLAELRERFGGRVDFAGCGARASYPLHLRAREAISAPRQVWIGNSAQTLHPVSGQGFNLGLRDAWQLGTRLAATGERSADPGDPALLAAYARSRRLDRQTSMAFTDGLVRLFSNDFAPLRAARGAGLLALDLCPPLRHFLAKRMIWGARAWP